MEKEQVREWMSLRSRKMVRDAPSTMLFLFASIIILCRPNSAQPLDFFCPENTIVYDSNSSFAANLNRLLISLASNTAASDGFYNTSVGSDSDQVYGLALCRGDVTADVCQNCVNTASQGILQECQNKQEAIIWYEFCQLRYSYWKFFSMMVYAGKFPKWNEREQNVTNPDEYSNIWDNLMRNLISQTESDRRMFATGEVISISKTEKIYGLMQCTRDIIRDECGNCLRNGVGDIQRGPFSRRGGMVLGTSCNLRYEPYLFYNGSSASPTPNGNYFTERKAWTVAIFISVPICVLLFLSGFYAYYIRGRKGRETPTDEQRIDDIPLQQIIGVSTSFDFPEKDMQDGNQMSSSELPLMDFDAIKVATDNFSDSNKLGQGGFGTVYKGILPNGKEVAVKRLSRKSWQGVEEFKNEIILIAKLQHRNLVRLLGCGIQGDEKLLVYDFMPNISLDSFIFDPIRRSQLDWRTYFSIIGGIARGLLYLHEDSRLKIIHRDLKPSNVLLDHDMTAKISDFGMAGSFVKIKMQLILEELLGHSNGYMAPEYAMEGLFSVKSDVFSFGVILLEIISGKRNSGFYRTEHAQTLLAFAWRLWVEGKCLEFADAVMLMDTTNTRWKAEVMRFIHIGLLCVQEDAADRP
uniref:non-specific serine/threonine protein kinase n=1 Tax=Nelumbo nucifera TaxID=4432 RepID=A0A822XGK3_NELNU|nr:TPA_asm: hypothetical protein HUJ06_022077 [Nelumbo nucifera]